MLAAQPAALQVMSPCSFARHNRGGLMWRVNVARLKRTINSGHGGGTGGGLALAPDAKAPKLHTID